MNASTEALISISHIRGKLKKRVFKQLLESDAMVPCGMTCDDIEERLDARHQTISARVHDLYNDGFIYRTKRQRRTRSGRLAVVYRVRKRPKKIPPRERCECCGQVLGKR